MSTPPYRAMQYNEGGRPLHLRSARASLHGTTIYLSNSVASELTKDSVGSPAIFLLYCPLSISRCLSRKVASGNVLW